MESKFAMQNIINNSNEKLFLVEKLEGDEEFDDELLIYPIIAWSIKFEHNLYWCIPIAIGSETMPTNFIVFDKQSEKWWANNDTGAQGLDSLKIHLDFREYKEK